MKKLTIILSLLLVAVLAGCGSFKYRPGESDIEPTTKSTYEKPTVSLATDAPTKPPTEPPTQKPTTAEDLYKYTCTEIDYKTLARNPDKYNGEKLKLSGEVGAVDEIEDSDEFFFELKLKDNSGSSSTYEIIVHGQRDKSIGRLNWFDTVTVWGVGAGIYKGDHHLTYDNGSPYVELKYYTIDKPLLNNIVLKEKPTSDTEKAFKDSCTDIDFDNLNRFPEKYEEKNITVIGEVFLISEKEDSVEITLTMGINNDYSIYKMVKIRGKMASNNRILNDDVIRVWGIGAGVYSDKACIDMKYYSIIE